MSHTFSDDELEDIEEPEPLEAYCVRCRDMVWLEDPIPVRTRKGAPATRGECPSCGGTVYRLGKTAAHQAMKPKASRRTARRGASDDASSGQSERRSLPKMLVYLNYAPADEDIAEQVAGDLERMGCALSLHPMSGDSEAIQPPLEDCSRMLVLLSPESVGEQSVESAWQFFRQRKKLVVVGTIAPADPPDPLRSRPRFDLARDYKRAFHQLLRVLSE